MSKQGEDKARLPEDIHHFSAIRVGDKWVYNGVNGDAFSFGTASTMSAAVSEPSLRSQDSNTGKRRVLPDVPTPVSLPASSVPFSTESSSTPDSTPPQSPRWSYFSMLPGSSAFKQSTPQQTQPTQSMSSLLTATPPRLSTTANTGELKASPYQKHTPPQPSPLVASPPRFPEAYGLPPILPRPPAAHLPPPLPSRPPSSVPSRSASPASSLSSKLSNYSDDELDELHSFDERREETHSAHNCPSFYRSSGTITVEASIKTFNKQHCSKSRSGSVTSRDSLSPTSPEPGAHDVIPDLKAISANKTASNQNKDKDKKSKTSSTTTSSISSRTTTNTTTTNDKIDNKIVSVKSVGETTSTSVAQSSASSSSTSSSLKSSTVSSQTTTFSISTPSSSSPNTAVVRPFHLLSEQDKKNDENESNTSSSDRETDATRSSISDDSSVRKKPISSKKSLPPVPRSSFFSWRRQTPQASIASSESEDKFPDGYVTAPESSPQLRRKKNQGPIPPELGSIRNRSMSVADVVTNALVVYKASKAASSSTKPKPAAKAAIKPKVIKAPNCRQCARSFGITLFRYFCGRCKGSFCDRCVPIKLHDKDDVDTERAALTRICAECSKELALEGARGQHRGLWTEFEKYRSEARDNRGLDVTTSTKHRQQLEVQKLLDMVPKLRGVCMRFLSDLFEELQRSQTRYKFITNYLQFENPVNPASKYKGVKTKQCTECNRQLRMLTEIRGCAMCAQAFCKLCTYRTLQLYLPNDTDLKSHITLDMIKFHVKKDEMDEVTGTEVSESYYVCMTCEDVVIRNLLILEFNSKIPDLEQEMFDLQRQIDYALSFDPYMGGVQKSASAASINTLNDNDFMATNIKIANKLYDRYMRAYDNLDHMQPQTVGQKMLHRHIKQAMYDFYVKRRDQLKTTLRRRDSWANLAADFK